MTQTLRILHLEDNPADALLVRDLLEHDGLSVDIRLVSNRAEFLEALPAVKWDVFISDYKLPDFTGLDALKIVRGEFPGLPFILVSGTIGELAALRLSMAASSPMVPDTRMKGSPGNSPLTIFNASSPVKSGSL